MIDLLSYKVIFLRILVCRITCVAAFIKHFDVNYVNFKATSLHIVLIVRTFMFYEASLDVEAFRQISLIYLTIRKDFTIGTTGIGS